MKERIMVETGEIEYDSEIQRREEGKLKEYVLISQAIQNKLDQGFAVRRIQQAPAVKVMNSDGASAIICRLRFYLERDIDLTD